MDAPRKVHVSRVWISMISTFLRIVVYQNEVILFSTSQEANTVPLSKLGVATSDDDDTEDVSTSPRLHLLDIVVMDDDEMMNQMYTS